MKAILLFLFLSCCLCSFITPAQSTSGSTWFIQSAEWSPDGKMICFAAASIDNGKFTAGHWEIYIVNVDGSNLHRITSNTVEDLWPSFSPDGKRLVFESSRDGNAEIYVMNIDGSNVQRLTNNSFIDLYPVFSPDGKSIVFSGKRNGNYELFRMNADGSNPVQLTTTSCNELNPQWSANGKKLLFFCDNGNGNDKVYVSNADGYGAINISNDSANNIFPGWLGDEQIICGSTYAGHHALFTLDAGGKGNKKLLEPSGFFARYSATTKKLVTIEGEWPSSSIFICAPDCSGKKMLVDANMLAGVK